MNEFLSRFVYIMRGNLNESYPDCDKPTIDAMLLVIVEKLVKEMEKGGNLEERLVSGNDDLSDDLWKTVWEVSSSVFQEMEREKKKEKMKKFLQSEEVKSMARFASEVGVRGDMLHELRFKWAREAMEKAEFYEGLEQAGEAAKEEKEFGNAEAVAEEEGKDSFVENGGGGGGGGLPKRHGKIKYKLYGLDLSGSVWKDVADRVHEAEEVISTQEAKPITGKCRLITERILGLGKFDDYEPMISPLLEEWKELLQPSRVDWISLIEKIKELDCSLYLKVVEHVFDDPSFQANIRDYSKLIDLYAKQNRFEDIERILKKMSGSGMAPDAIILTGLLHMYSKANNLEQAHAVFEALKSQGYKPDLEVYNSMLMVYANSGEVKLGEKLMIEMELKDIKRTQDNYMAMLRAVAKKGDSTAADRIFGYMQFSGYPLTAESYALVIEVSNLDNAKNYFDEMRNLGFKPDDRCTSSLISAYAKKNELGKALHLLLQLEKDGFEPGVSTYSVLVDWLAKLQLVDEAEQMVNKISQLGEAPPLKIHVSLCDMYARAGIEKKALQALGVLEAKKDLLVYQDFERITQALIKGGFVQDAERIYKLIEAQGFTPSDSLKISMTASKSFGGSKTSKKSRIS